MKQEQKSNITESKTIDTYTKGTTALETAPINPCMPPNFPPWFPPDKFPPRYPESQNIYCNAPCCPKKYGCYLRAGGVIYR